MRPQGNAIGNLFKNISLAVLLNLGVKTLWILANQSVQDKIGHEAFGTYLALFALGFLLITFSDLGINQYATKTLAGNPNRLKELFPHLLGIKIFLSLLYPFLMVGVGWMMGYEGETLFFLYLIALTHGIMQVVVFFRANFQAFQWFRLDAWASILDRFVLLILVALLLVLGINLQTYILAVLASAVSAFLVLWLVLIRTTGLQWPSWKWSQAGALLKETFPFAVITILYSVNDKVDQVMLERLLKDGGKETGLYGAAYRWVDTVMMYLWTILPIFFARFAQVAHDRNEQQKLMSFGQPLAAIPMVFAAVFVWFFGDKLFFSLKNSRPEEMETMVACLRILFISVAVNGFFAILSTLLTSTGHERFVSWMIGISILLNVGSNWLFIPTYGAVAAAWATLASFSFLSLSYIVYMEGFAKIHLPWREIGKSLVVSLVFAGVFWALHSTGMAWWAVSTLSGGALVSFSLLLGLLPNPFRRNHA